MVSIGGPLLHIVIVASSSVVAPPCPTGSMKLNTISKDVTTSNLLSFFIINPPSIIDLVNMGCFPGQDIQATCYLNLISTLIIL